MKTSTSGFVEAWFKARGYSVVNFIDAFSCRNTLQVSLAWRAMSNEQHSGYTAIVMTNTINQIITFN